jgi:hypothetical protein
MRATSILVEVQGSTETVNTVRLTRRVGLNTTINALRYIVQNIPQFTIKKSIAQMRKNVF